MTIESDATTTPATSRMRQLSDTEAREMLAVGSRVGRLAFVKNNRLHIYPVNYVADNSGILIRTDSDSFTASIAGLDVAFEVDDFRPLEHTGWSVVVHGVARSVDDEEADLLRRGPLHAWAWQRPDMWIRITIGSVAGRMISDE